MVLLFPAMNAIKKNTGINWKCQFEIKKNQEIRTDELTQPSSRNSYQFIPPMFRLLPRLSTLIRTTSTSTSIAIRLTSTTNSIKQCWHKPSVNEGTQVPVVTRCTCSNEQPVWLKHLHKCRAAQAVLSLCDDLIRDMLC